MMMASLTGLRQTVDQLLPEISRGNRRRRRDTPIEDSDDSEDQPLDLSPNKRVTRSMVKQ